MIKLMDLPEKYVLSEEEHSMLGFEIPVPGHHLSVYNQTSWSTTLACQCGNLQIWSRQLENGKVSGHYTKDYKTHLLNLSIPSDSMTRVGSIIKKRVIWDLNVFTVHHPETIMYAQNKHWKDWVLNGPLNVYIWILGAEKRNPNPSGKQPQNSILGLYRSRHDAVVQAFKKIDTAEQAGVDVARFIDLEASIEANTTSISDIITDLVARADMANTGSQIGMLRQMEELLSLVPIIQSKADTLKSKLNLSNLALE